MTLRLTHPFGTGLGIFFPPGKNQSCDFATPKCLKECGLKPNDYQLSVLDIFEHKSVGRIIDKLLSEVPYYKVLSWFCSGDCPAHLTDKIAEIILAIKEEKKGTWGTGFHRINQNGFTRNKELWLKLQGHDGRERSYSGSYRHRIRIALTVETYEEVEKYRDQGLLSIPDYGSWATEIIHPYSKEIFMGCGSSFVTVKTVGHPERQFPEDCTTCFRHSTGCFYQVKSFHENCTKESWDISIPDNTPFDYDAETEYNKDNTSCGSGYGHGLGIGNH